MATPDYQPVDVLRKYFGYPSFRPNQAEAIDATLRRKDVLAVMPTGGGKSMLFAIPTLCYATGITVVISPLLSLIKDQIASFARNGIDTRALNGEITAEELAATEDDLRSERPSTRILITTPETLSSNRTRALLHGLNARNLLLHLAIDEAHCISEWGHNFRPKFRELSAFRNQFPEVPTIALTATATPRVVSDIVKSLRLREDHEKHLASFDRPNLRVAVRFADDIGGLALDDKDPGTKQILGHNSATHPGLWDMALTLAACLGERRWLARRFPKADHRLTSFHEGHCVMEGLDDDPTKPRAAAAAAAGAGGDEETVSPKEHRKAIIYCQNRANVDMLHALFDEFGFHSFKYHAGMKPDVKDAHMKGWFGAKRAVMVATVAFGMGIDCGCVRLVLHYGMPKDMASYYQEIGRAGRDGLPSSCIMYFRYKDVDRARWVASLSIKSALDATIDKALSEGNGGSPPPLTKGQIDAMPPLERTKYFRQRKVQQLQAEGLGHDLYFAMVFGHLRPANADELFPRPGMDPETPWIFSQFRHQSGQAIRRQFSSATLAKLVQRFTFHLRAWMLALKETDTMINYCHSKGCRRGCLVHHFGQPLVPGVNKGKDPTAASVQRAVAKVKKLALDGIDGLEPFTGCAFAGGELCDACSHLIPDDEYKQRKKSMSASARKKFNRNKRFEASFNMQAAMSKYKDMHRQFQADGRRTLSLKRQRAMQEDAGTGDGNARPAVQSAAAAARAKPKPGAAPQLSISHSGSAAVEAAALKDEAAKVVSKVDTTGMSALQRAKLAAARRFNEEVDVADVDDDDE